MIGTRLSDRYVVSAELGRGGMGVVYLARDPLLNREVAVKLIPPGLVDSEAELRFHREAQLVAQLDHPSIVSIFDFGRHEGSLFFVMPVVQGTNLRAFLRERAALGDIVDIGIEVAEALEYSHGRGVFHRDIKPENLMVNRDDTGRVRVRVMDFGLARGGTENRLTRSGALMGTLAYLSPEQVAGREVDGRSDVYSLGTVLYECVVGEPPFGGEFQNVVYRIVHELPQPPRTMGAAIDETLEGIILICLAKAPAERYAKASDLAETLRRYRNVLHDSDRERSVAAMTRTFLGPRPLPAPFVGRAREFGELQQRLNAAAMGECQFALVGGDAGIGKTRLLDELETLCRARRVRVLHGRCVEQDGSFPYQGFGEVIQEYFRLKDTGSAPPPEFSDLAAELVALFPMLGEIAALRSSGGEPSGARLAPVAVEDRTQVFELLARTLTRLASGRPLVIVLEDLHAAVVSVEALQYVIRRLGPTPILVVGSYRSTDVDGRHPLARVLESFRGDRRFVPLSLAPFTQSEHRLFLETLVGGTQLSERLVRQLYEGGEGNPFFTKELVRSLLDSGGIAKDDSGTWILSSEMGLSADALPATIQQAVEKRIERLPDDLREVLSLAAVIGRTFDGRDLEKLADAPGGVDDALDRLVRDGLIEEQRESRGDVLSFSSGVVRDVLYAGLSRRRRRSLHRRFAEHLEARHKGRLERILPQLLLHSSQGDVPDKSVEYGLRLASSSLEAFSALEAARSARTALEFLDEEWEGDRALEGEARMLLARAHRMAGDIEPALKEAEAAVRVFERERQPARMVAALQLAAETAWQARRTAETSGFVERGLEAARAAGDREALRPLLTLAATLANLLGEYDKANGFLEEASLLVPPREEEADEEVPRGGRLVVALTNPVATLEPVAIATNEEIEIATNVFEPLIATDPQGNLVPSLCERWEVRDEGRTFVLALRDNVRFSDGTPLTAAELKACIEAAVRRAPSELPAAWAAIAGAADHRAGRAPEISGLLVREEQRLEVRLSEPLVIYPALLTEGASGIARVVEGEGAPRPAGTGPFRLTRHDADRVVLERNDLYWRGDTARLDAIEFRPSMSATAIVRAFREGEIDLARDLLPHDLEDLQRDLRFRRGLVETPKRNTYFILFNAAGPRAREATLRKALTGVIRTRDLVWQTVGRFAQPAACLIPPGMLGHDPGRRARLLSREEAKALLTGSRFAPPLRLNVSVHPILHDRYGALLTELFATWAELGVEVDVATFTMATYLDTWKRNEGIDVTVGRWNADYDDPDNFTYTLFHSQAGALRGYFASEETDRLLEAARSEGRPHYREALYRKFEDALAEASAVVPLFHDIDYRVASPLVRGLTLRGTAPYVNYSEVGKVEAAEEVEVRTGGGTLHVPMTGLVTSIDPARGGTVEQSEVMPSIFETLTRDAGGARVLPWLAAEYQVEDGGRRYRFRLRDDVRFHDGRRLTARDVRYSFERLLQTSSGNDPRWLYTCIRGARALIAGEAGDLEGLRIHSAGELSIELEEPVAFFPALLAFDSASIVPEGSDPSRSSWQEGCVGTGPFRVVAFEPGQRLELERNRAYWRKGLPRSEGLSFAFGVDPKDVVAGFRAGRYSLAADLFPEDAEALRQDPEFAARYRETPRLITYYAVFNTVRGPLSDRSLRQRLASAVDVPRIVRQTLGRLGVPARGLIPPGLLGHDTAALPRPPAATSAPSGPAIELTAVMNPLFFANYSGLARELAIALNERGFRLRPTNRTMAEWLEAAGQGSVDVMVGRWSADYPDADTFVQILHTHGLLGKYCGSPEIDRLVERGRTESSPAARHALYRQIEEIVARDVLLLPLFHEQAYRFARPEVEGLAVSLWGQTVPYEALRARG